VCQDFSFLCHINTDKFLAGKSWPPFSQGGAF
jgi:hypothetical protein